MAETNILTTDQQHAAEFQMLRDENFQLRELVIYLSKLVLKNVVADFHAKS
jgi:hypothetical protein